MEYPPGALVAFLPPRLVAAHYNAAFKVLMALCGVATLVLLVVVLQRLGASIRHVAAAGLLFALSPIALGPISLNTYDAFPAALTLAALAALVAAWDAAALGALGLAFAAKVYPVVLVPAALVYVWRARGRRRAVVAAASFAAVTVAVVLPFLVLAPHGLLDSFRAQAGRSLQVESLGAQALVAADHVGAYSATVVHRTGRAISYDLAGPFPDALAVASSALQLVAVAAATLLFVRGRGDARRLALASAAAVAGFLAFSRFLSPQYVVWLVPMVLLVSRPLVWGALAGMLILAQSWFFHYRALVELSQRNWLVLVRDLLLVAVVAALLRLAAKDEDPVVLEDEAPLGAPS